MLNSREIATVIEKNRKVANSEFVIFYSLNKLRNCQFGVGISSKLVKKATRRNYYKRQIKNILAGYKNFCRDSLSNYYDLVVIIRLGFLSADKFSARQGSLAGLLDSIFQKKSETNQSTNKNVLYA